MIVKDVDYYLEKRYRITTKILALAKKEMDPARRIRTSVRSFKTCDNANRAFRTYVIATLDGYELRHQE